MLSHAVAVIMNVAAAGIFIHKNKPCFMKKGNVSIILTAFLMFDKEIVSILFI